MLSLQVMAKPLHPWISKNRKATPFNTWSPPHPVAPLQVEWREHSFLQNPRLSAAVNKSRLLVEVCVAGGEWGGAVLPGAAGSLT